MLFRSVIKVLYLWEVPGSAFLASELSQFWAFYGNYTVIDCRNDSTIMDTVPPVYCAGPACYSASERRAYEPDGNQYDNKMYAIDMNTMLTEDSIHVPSQWYSGPVYCATQAHKVYWLFDDPHGMEYIDSVFVVDTRSNTVVGKFVLPELTSQMVNDRTGEYAYFISDTLTVVDTHTDCVVNKFGLPTYLSNMARNNMTNRLYLAGRCDTIDIFYDSVVVGVEEPKRMAKTETLLPTVFSRAVPFRSATCSSFFDASGRRVAISRNGQNDISGLAPGVYFTRTLRTADGRPDAIHKIVIAR